jgi:hypothetical protein
MELFGFYPWTQSDVRVVLPRIVFIHAEWFSNSQSNFSSLQQAERCYSRVEAVPVVRKPEPEGCF